MASGSSRRGFLGKVGAGIAAVGTASLLAEKAEAACTLPAGCFGTVSVNVCYSPWLVTHAEAGQSGVVLRKGPSFSADPVTNGSTGAAVVVPVGGTFARCSNRDGGSGCPDPGPRANQNGFLWGYWIGYARQGWMPYSVGGVTYATGNNGYTGTLCGPAGFDFDCRLGTQHPKSACNNTCGGSGTGTPTCSTTYRPIVANPADPSDERFYLRYAVNSTTFFWLVPGDQVKRWAYESSGSFTWSCVEVICAKYAPNGCRGWVRSDALGDPNSNNTACFPSVTCPSGS
jgi:hypothetical protein